MGRGVSRKRELDLNLDTIKQQFLDCAMHHSRFVKQEKLDHRQQIELEKLSKLYMDYCKEAEITADMRGFAISGEDYRNKTPFERYLDLHKLRSLDLLQMYQGVCLATGIPKEVNGLDIGCGSAFFMNALNYAYIAHGAQSSWYGVDIEGSKSPVTDGTGIDRDKLNTFREFKAGEPFPTFRDPKAGFWDKLQGKDKLQFDVATMFYVLHHIPEEQLDSAIQQAYVQLKPGGKLVILEDHVGIDEVVPARMKFIKAMDQFFYPNFPGNQKPITEWVGRLEKAGFKEVQIGEASYFNSVGIRTDDALIVMEKPR